MFEGNAFTVAIVAVEFMLVEWKQSVGQRSPPCQAQARPFSSQVSPTWKDPSTTQVWPRNDHCDLILSPAHAAIPGQLVELSLGTGHFWQADQVSPMTHSNGLLVWWPWLWLRPFSGASGQHCGSFQRHISNFTKEVLMK